jgi:DNA-binding NarL/FixJ family response regulator
MLINADDVEMVEEWQPQANGHKRQYWRPSGIVVVDARDSMEQAIGVLTQLKSLYPGPKYLVIGDICDAELAVTAIRAGMDGLLWAHELNHRNLLRCIRGMEAGELGLPRRIAASLLPLVRAVSPPTPEAILVKNALQSRLTPREREILSEIAKGARSKEIAATLNIAPKTVNKHVQNILTKLKVHSRVAALREVGASQRIGYFDGVIPHLPMPSTPQIGQPVHSKKLMQPRA